MSNYDYDDYADYDDYDEETQDYIRRVRQQLKSIKKLTDDQIYNRLEATDWSIEKTVAFFKQKEATKQGKATKAAPLNTKIPPETTTVAHKKEITTADTASGGDAVSSISTPLMRGTSDGSATSAHGTRGDLILSDDEDLGVQIKSTGPSRNQSLMEVNSTTSIVPLTMVVSGHVDAGKSTLIGHLLYKCGQVNQRTLHKYEKESKAIGKASFSLAWVMDQNQSEREHGVTIDVAERQLRTKRHLLTILDTPGHKDFIPNMIKGAAQADVAVLVVPAGAGEFESSMKETAQTREHATLLKALGVNQVIVAVNKMDNTSPTPWSETRFQAVQAAITTLLVQDMQFNPRLVRFVPVSGLTGENITTIDDAACPLKSWYDGPTLMESIDGFTVPPRFSDKPLRAAVREVLSVDQSKGKCDVEVSILQGSIRLNRTVGYYNASIALPVAAAGAAGIPISALFLMFVTSSSSSSGSRRGGGGGTAVTGTGTIIPVAAVHQHVCDYR
mmetsp:Transcript_5756/g.9467  ORF Transcript_5756/g.9467 Transcript_5756/m.9467 type:complete len:501 (+) Transcript_5756:69-1571(+)